MGLIRAKKLPELFPRSENCGKFFPPPTPFPTLLMKNNRRRPKDDFCLPFSEAFLTPSFYALSFLMQRGFPSKFTFLFSRVAEVLVDPLY